jgi:hypothetical protein
MVLERLRADKHRNHRAFQVESTSGEEGFVIVSYTSAL